MAESWPTEALATEAVDSAARKVYTDWATDAHENVGVVLPSYNELGPTQKLQYRHSVLPIVWAALTSLPDPRYAAWEEGRAAGLTATDNPYSSGI